MSDDKFDTIYIKVRVNVVDDPKIINLAAALDISDREALSHMIYLWRYAMIHFPVDGILVGLSDGAIAKIADWKGSHAEFVTALVECGGPNCPGLLDVTDRGYALHAWRKHHGEDVEDTLDRRRAKAERERERRRLAKGTHMVVTEPIPLRRVHVDASHAARDGGASCTCSSRDGNEGGTCQAHGGTVDDTCQPRGRHVPARNGHVPVEEKEEEEEREKEGKKERISPSVTSTVDRAHLTDDQTSILERIQRAFPDTNPTSLKKTISLIKTYPDVNLEYEAELCVEWCTKRKTKIKDFGARLTNWINGEFDGKPKQVMHRDGKRRAPSVHTEPRRVSIPETEDPIWREILQALYDEDAPRHCLLKPGQKSFFETWIAPCKCLGVTGNTISIGVPNEKHLRELTGPFARKMDFALTASGHDGMTYDFVVMGDDDES